MKLNLQATTKEEQKVKAYLEANASEVLAEKINGGVRIQKDGKTLINKKTLAGFSSSGLPSRSSPIRSNMDTCGFGCGLGGADFTAGAFAVTLGMGALYSVPSSL